MSSLDSTVTDLKKSIKYGTMKLDSTLSSRGRMFPGVLIGIGLADKMGVREGSEVVLGSLVTAEGQDDPVPTMARFTVSGVFETGMYEYDLSLVYVSIRIRSIPACYEGG